MLPRHSDTIIAPATLPGTGAISIVRLSGPDALEAAGAIVKINSGNLADYPGYTAHYGIIYTESGDVLDEVVATVFKSPKSYTGEDMVEICCHASSFIVSEVLRLFTSKGLRLATPGEFTERAFLGGKMDLAQAEAVADVISSTTSASHRVAMNQLRGGVSRRLSDLRTELLKMTSLLELELDFSEEDVQFADRSELLSLSEEASKHLSHLVETYRLGNAIRTGIPVAIVGPANAGKSTLLNLLLGDERAIVSPIAGTTRDTIEETLNLGGILFRLIDTAGIRDTSETVETMGISRTFKKISEAEIVILVLDASDSEFDLLNNIKAVTDTLARERQDLVILVNKCDFVSAEVVNKNVSIINNFVLSSDIKANILKFSAKTSFGLEELKTLLANLRKDTLPSSDSTFITNARHYEALSSSLSHLTDASHSLRSGTPADLIAEHLRLAISDLGRITGDTITPSEILGNIFGKFCIGK